MPETQHTIDSWATEAFGPGRPLAAFRRAEEEIREFLLEGDLGQDSAYHQPEFRSAIMEEAADVVITFYRLAAILGEDLHRWIDQKMAKNRARQWVAHGDGTGHHIKSSQVYDFTQAGKKIIHEFVVRKQTIGSNELRSWLLTKIPAEFIEEAIEHAIKEGIISKPTIA